jgi:hypothetical protein
MSNMTCLIVRVFYWFLGQWVGWYFVNENINLPVFWSPLWPYLLLFPEINKISGDFLNSCCLAFHLTGAIAD